MDIKKSQWREISIVTFSFPAASGSGGFRRHTAFPSPFPIENGGQGGEDPEAASQLFFRFGVDAVQEFQMAVYHPLGRPPGVRAAEELEGRPYGDHYSSLQMRLQQTHEYFLFGCA